MVTAASSRDQFHDEAMDKLFTDPAYGFNNPIYTNYWKSHVSFLFYTYSRKGFENQYNSTTGQFKNLSIVGLQLDIYQHTPGVPKGPPGYAPYNPPNPAFFTYLQTIYAQYSKIHADLANANLATPAHQSPKGKPKDQILKFPKLEVKGELKSDIPELDRVLNFPIVKWIFDCGVKALHYPRFMLMQLYQDRKELAAFAKKDKNKSAYAATYLNEILGLGLPPKGTGEDDADYESRVRRDANRLGGNSEEINNIMSQSLHNDLLNRLRASDNRYIGTTNFFTVTSGEETKDHLYVFQNFIRESLATYCVDPATNQVNRKRAGHILQSLTQLIMHEERDDPGKFKVYTDLLNYWLEKQVINQGASSYDDWDNIADTDGVQHHLDMEERKRLYGADVFGTSSSAGAAAAAATAAAGATGGRS